MSKVMICLWLLAFYIQAAALEKTSKPASVRNSATEKTYRIFLNEAYRELKTKSFKGLEFSDDCFKNAKLKHPICEAYEFIQIKPKKMVAKHILMNNVSAIYCSEIFGKNLIALDLQNNEYNFCQFPDGSMVGSWSAYENFKKMKK